MTYYQQSPPGVSQSFHEQRTQFPDILSAPAPVLSDHGIVVDGETVAQWDDSSSFARPSPVNTTVSPTYRHHSQPSSISPAMSSITTSPTSVSPPAASQPSPAFARPPQSSQQPLYQASTYDPYSSRDDNHHPSRTPSSQYSPRHSSSSLSSPQNYHQSAVVLHQTRDMMHPAPRPPQVERMRQRRKVATAAAGVVGGIAGLAVLGPVGALAGGVGGAMLTKHAGKRMERKQTERIAAARHALEEERYGRSVPALQADSALT